jgi:hypothetical protein
MTLLSNTEMTPEKWRSPKRSTAARPPKAKRAPAPVTDPEIAEIDAAVAAYRDGQTLWPAPLRLVHP